MPKRHIVLDDWSKGEYGRTSPSFNDVGTFKGTDVWIYNSGGIGPRSPFIKLDTTGVLTLTRADHLIYNDATSKAAVIYGAAVYSLALSNLFTETPDVTVASLGNMANTMTDFVSSGVEIFGVRSGGAGGVRVNLSSGTITAIGALPAGHIIRVFGFQWIVVNTTSATPNRILYSALGDPTSWPGNFVDVGDLTAIRNVYTQRDALVVEKVSGEWWAITGVLGNETIRRIDRGLFHEGAGAQTNSQNIWWVNNDRVCAFSGAQIYSELRPLPPDFEATTDAMASLSEDDDFILFGQYDSGGQRLPYAQVRRGGAWTQHKPLFGQGTSGAGILNIKAVSVGNGVVLAMAQARTGVTSTQFYIFNPRSDPPLVASETDTQDAVVSSFDTSEFWAESGGILRIHEVIVDFTAFASEDVNCTFNVYAQTSLLPGDSDGVTSSGGSFTLGAPAAPVQHRAVFTFGDQGEGGGGRIKFTNMIGVVIHRVVVVADEIPPVMT